MIDNKKLIIPLVVGLLLGLLLFIPVQWFISDDNLPENTKINIYKGSLYSGSANLFVTQPDTTNIMLLSWRLCLSKNIPFVSMCMDLQSQDESYSGKIVGIPGDEMLIKNFQGTMEINRLIELSGNQLLQNSLAFLNLRGNLDADVQLMRLSIAEGLPIRWDGDIRLSNGGFFNVNLPSINLMLSNEDFISQAEDNLPSEKLPTMTITGSNEQMDIYATIQFLEARNIKFDMEVLARDSLILQTFVPLATNVEGNRVFINYQSQI